MRFNIDAHGDITDEALPSLQIILITPTAPGYPSHDEYAKHICKLLNDGVDAVPKPAKLDS